MGHRYLIQLLTTLGLIVGAVPVDSGFSFTSQVNVPEMLSCIHWQKSSLCISVNSLSFPKSFHELTSDNNNDQWQEQLYYESFREPRMTQQSKTKSFL